LLAAVDWRTPGEFTAAERLGNTTVHGDVLQDQTDDPVIGLQRDLLIRVKRSGFVRGSGLPRVEWRPKPPPDPERFSRQGPMLVTFCGRPL
jgi:hypothetical protein